MLAGGILKIKHEDWERVRITHFYLQDLPEVGGDRGEDHLMCVDGRSIGAGQGHVHKVLKFENII